MENITLWAAFLGGILAFLSPCVLPIIPGYIAYISGVSATSVDTEKKIDWQTVISAVAFVLGFSIVFTLLGAASTFVGQFLQEYKSVISKIAAIVVILLGIHFTGVLQSAKAKVFVLSIGGLSLLYYLYEIISLKQYFSTGFFIFLLGLSLVVFYFSGAYRILYEQKTTEVRKKPPGPIGAFLVGLAFALGWTPCIGPILGAILLVASQQETVNQGMLLLFAFSMGLGIPFVLTAAAINLFFKFFAVVRKYFLFIEVAGGILLILIGILLMTGNFEKISSMLG
ncbi:cytochrome c biogenesis CcdA family protein [Sulfurihydrogenibium subterraneum]|uniref:cytochrome c biogenesis CcdA family protein n=1 Tax=Sulfurihydrogenibium subterraneum TaxID=171121 RepID=UPI00048D9D98|nr:cytochrome c biogenesis protein CcdA [Sulfurihydrogenibium subterraneum]